MSFTNASNRFIEATVADLAAYLHELAHLVEGDSVRFDTYMDCADALLDVRNLWADDEAYFASRGQADIRLETA